LWATQSCGRRASKALSTKRARTRNRSHFTTASAKAGDQAFTGWGPATSAVVRTAFLRRKHRWKQNAVPKNGAFLFVVPVFSLVPFLIFTAESSKTVFVSRNLQKKIRHILPTSHTQKNKPSSVVDV
jgi:hypothetical protein